MNAAIAVYAWKRPATSGARQFALFMLSMAIYILGYGMELASLDVDTMLFWSKIQYIGILTFPTLFLIFTLYYTGRSKWLTSGHVALLFVLPAALLVAKLLDGQLHLIYTSAEVDASGSIPLLAFTRGPLYLVVVAYNLTVVTWANFLLWRKRRSASLLYRQQSNIILTAAVVIYLVYIYYLSGLMLFPSLKHLDLNPFVYSLWGCAVGFAIFRYWMFDLAPIARDALIEMLSDGVIVLDAQTRLVDANPEALKIFGWRQPPVGELARSLMPSWVDSAALDRMDGQAKFETHLSRENATIYYEVTVSALTEKPGHKIGYLMVAHDISERKGIEKEFRELSLVDELTGLVNRRGFRMLASQLIGMANRMQLSAALFYIDMDELKSINDSLGHATGDLALVDAGQILKSTFRSSDIISRYGGDEFIILALEPFENSGEFMLARLQERLNTYNAQGSHPYTLTFSIGQARYDWKNPRSIEELLATADHAMYVVKQGKKAAAGPAI